jgi:biopolymer transport protein ExbB
MSILSLPFAFTLMGQTPMELFKHGGPVMWPVIVLSFVTVTVTIERILFIIKENASRDDTVVEKMLEKVENRDIEGAIAVGKPSKDFVARILVYSLTHKEHGLSNAFMRASGQELRRYNQGMPTLDTCVMSAPYVGLLGTVTGMMNTFGALGTGADISESSAAITGGVAEGLIATAAGLAIALFGMYPFNYVQSKIEEAKSDISDANNALELIIKKSELTV